MEDICFVAEFTTNPMGNLNLLLKMTREAKAAGCSLIKMQKKDVGSFYSKQKLESPYISPYGKTFRDYREIFEFDEYQFKRFDEECRSVGIGWFATAQDIPSLEFLARFDLPIYKVASTNIGNEALLRGIAADIPKSKELVVSTAGASLWQIENALNILSGFSKTWVLHCVAEYPCPNANCKLGNIPELRSRFESPDVAIGYSGHEEGYLPTLAAVSHGAKMVERHFCVSRESFVHHIECSLEPAEYAELIGIIRNAASAEELAQYRDKLPPGALSASFTMSEKEADFLVEGKYGRKYIGSRSSFGHEK
jgi:N-acetylneuraminate synthase